MVRVAGSVRAAVGAHLADQGDGGFGDERRQVVGHDRQRLQLPRERVHGGQARRRKGHRARVELDYALKLIGPQRANLVGEKGRPTLPRAPREGQEWNMQLSVLHTTLTGRERTLSSC